MSSQIPWDEEKIAAPTQGPLDKNLARTDKNFPANSWLLTTVVSRADSRFRRQLFRPEYG
eukprot:scaffold86582_cov45-Phaeocystis_antarctica.AAC.1